jgi:hypothetical protein
MSSPVTTFLPVHGCEWCQTVPWQAHDEDDGEDINANVDDGKGSKP